MTLVCLFIGWWNKLTVFNFCDNRFRFRLSGGRTTFQHGLRASKWTLPEEDACIRSVPSFTLCHYNRRFRNSLFSICTQGFTNSWTRHCKPWVCITVLTENKREAYRRRTISDLKFYLNSLDSGKPAWTGLNPEHLFASPLKSFRPLRHVIIIIQCSLAEIIMESSIVLNAVKINGHQLLRRLDFMRVFLWINYSHVVLYHRKVIANFSSKSFANDEFKHKNLILIGLW